MTPPAGTAGAPPPVDERVLFDLRSFRQPVWRAVAQGGLFLTAAALGLSMAFDFDIYLIDEVTAAGDQRFREKSKRILMERRQNSDFLMVDHNLWGLKLHCNRAFILEGGKIEVYDDLDEAVTLHTERLLAAPAQRGVDE